MKTRDQFDGGDLPEKWLQHGLDILRRKEINVDYYQNKIIKERILDAMAVPNILALIECARELDGLNDGEVFERLGLDPRTPNRWLKEEVQPHSRMFFGILSIGLRREIDEVFLPRNRTLIWESVGRTMAIIRQRELDGGGAPLEKKEFGYVRSLMWNSAADLLVPLESRDGKPDPRDVDKLLIQVIRETKKAIPNFGPGSARAALQAIDAWAESYVLFRIGLRWEWSFLYEDAV